MLGAVLTHNYCFATSAKCIMPFYCVQIDAANFLIDVDGKTVKHGFIAFRNVEAENQSEAENVAVQMLRDDQELRKLVKNEKSGSSD